jgi:uncharacterized protein (TIGR03000 family)
MIHKRLVLAVLPLLAVGALLLTAPGAQAQRGGGRGGGWSGGGWSPGGNWGYGGNFYRGGYGFYGRGFYPSFYGGWGNYGYPSTSYSSGYYYPYYNYDYSSDVYAAPSYSETAPYYYTTTGNMADQNQRVTVDVQVPADAQLWFNGQQTNDTGPQRSFMSPPVAPGQNYTYDLRARWMQNGQPVDQTQHITVRAGEHRRVDFPMANATPGQPAPTTPTSTTPSSALPATDLEFAQRPGSTGAPAGTQPGAPGAGQP